MADLSPYVAGKTGTTDNENDAWFVGFSNEVTVAVWVGYDNADGKRRTLGGGATGGHTAVPIFQPIMQAVWAHVAPKTALAPPSPEARRLLSCKAVDPELAGKSAASHSPSASASMPNGKIADTQYRLISRESTYAGEDGNAARERKRGPRHGTIRYYSVRAPQGFVSHFGWGSHTGGWYQQDQPRRYGGYQRFWNP